MKKTRLTIILLMILTLVSAIITLCMGAVRIPVQDTLSILLRHLFGTDTGTSVSVEGAGIAFKDPKLDHGAVISKIIELSNVARKEGLLALEEVASNLEDEFMKKGILLIVDGTEPELVRGILETELANMDDRHRKVSGFFDYMAAMGPAWGMIGTLIGLVNMLAKLDDISTVGPNMAVALITTLYGSIIANWFATPVSNKLKLINNNEYQMKEIVIEGLLSIQAGENPRVIEEKLKSFLAPGSRQLQGEGEGGNAGGEA